VSAGSGGEGISCFVLITPADKPDELIGCFLLLIAGAREIESLRYPVRGRETDNGGETE
jgi:hypothetical protein